MDWSRVVTEAHKEQTADAALRKAIKQRRDTALNAGTTVGGMTVATDDTSQQRILGAAVAALLDPSLQVQWKLPDGSFVMLDATMITVVAQAIRAHVQACFNREAELHGQISSNEAYDIEDGWPV